MKRFLFSPLGGGAAIGLFALRVVTGVVFAVHGHQKLFGVGLSRLPGMFSQMGAPLPGVTGPLFGICELVFGIAVIFGLLTRLGTLWFTLDMLGAIAVVHIKIGWSRPGGMEFPVLLLSAAIAVFLAGPGALAIDNLIARRGQTPSI